MPTIAALDCVVARRRAGRSLRCATFLIIARTCQGDVEGPRTQVKVGVGEDKACISWLCADDGCGGRKWINIISGNGSK